MDEGYYKQTQDVVELHKGKMKYFKEHHIRNNTVDYYCRYCGVCVTDDLKKHKMKEE